MTKIVVKMVAILAPLAITTVHEAGKRYRFAQNTVKNPLAQDAPVAGKADKAAPTQTAPAQARSG